MSSSRYLLKLISTALSHLQPTIKVNFQMCHPAKLWKDVCVCVCVCVCVYELNKWYSTLIVE